ncbi:MAG TPA: HAMP domain-containing sensor histidine kinase [Bryobacteraceae bacterium]|nr:HAMP domain-containing sensor histidine kinase [Bryobacteraceae bacterium]
MRNSHKTGRPAPLSTLRSFFPVWRRGKTRPFALLRTIFAKILLWSFGTLVLSLAAYLFISTGFASRIAGRGGPFQRTVEFQVDGAEESYRTGGAPALAGYLHKLQRYFGPEHYFTDAQGRDLVTGEDRSALLATAHGEYHMPHQVGDHFVAVNPTADGLYRLIVMGRPPFTRWTFLPYYGLILVVVALLCWLLAINIVSPLRALAHTVESFGGGDLSARARSGRRDEIGDLARAFDRMAERIETLLTAERRLLQDISHELRSPLARLSFAAELSKTAEDRNAAAARIKKDIDRLTNLVGALVEMTRVEGDPAARRAGDVDLRELVQELVEAGRTETEARACRLHLVDSGALVVRGDRELLYRAIENVLRNAIRYAPEGSAIDVTLEPAGDMAAISVRDYGPGVPDAMLAKIFQPFVRVDESRASHTGGVGLGLAIAYRAISAHQGRIVAENAGPGLRVRLEIPAQRGAR